MPMKTGIYSRSMWIPASMVKTSTVLVLVREFGQEIASLDRKYKPNLAFGLGITWRAANDRLIVADEWRNMLSFVIFSWNAEQRRGFSRSGR